MKRLIIELDLILQQFVSEFKAIDFFPLHNFIGPNSYNPISFLVSFYHVVDTYFPH